MENKDKTVIANEMIDVGKNLVGIISDVINGRTPEFNAELDYKKLYILAEKHKITAVTAYGVKDVPGVPEDIKSLFETQLFRTAARHTAQVEETKAISKQFTDAGIHHCFLKGTKISDFYDVPDMRFMLDMDVFVEPNKAELAEKIMLNRGYEKTGSDNKDTGFQKKPFLLVEIHRELKYDYDIGCEYFKNAYKHLVPSDNGGLELKMTNEDFYVYILSHSAHHFSVSGTGLRSIVDHWFVCKKLLPGCDKNELKKKLRDSGLSVFNEKMTELSEYMFGGGNSDELTLKMEDYVILSGVFGNEENEYINGVLRRGLSEDKGRYFISRLFPGLQFMKINYPVLSKLPVLLPFCWCLRILQSLFSAKRLKGEAVAVKSTSQNEKEMRAEFFKEIGI